MKRHKNLIFSTFIEFPQNPKPENCYIQDVQGTKSWSLEAPAKNPRGRGQFSNHKPHSNRFQFNSGHLLLWAAPGMIASKGPKQWQTGKWLVQAMCTATDFFFFFFCLDLFQLRMNARCHLRGSGGCSNMANRQRKERSLCNSPGHDLVLFLWTGEVVFSLSLCSDYDTFHQRYGKTSTARRPNRSTRFNLGDLSGF